MYCSGGDKGASLRHDDQYRGLEYCYTRRPGGAGTTVYAEPSPDYLQYIDLGGPGLVPVGYGYRSVEYIVKAAIRLEAEAGDLSGRQRILKEYDDAGVMEAGRLSILNGGREAQIVYGDLPAVSLRS